MQAIKEDQIIDSEGDLKLAGAKEADGRGRSPGSKRQRRATGKNTNNNGLGSPEIVALVGMTQPSQLAL